MPLGPRSQPSNGTPGPTYMSDKQMGDYLNNLRTNRISRPNGSRPPPQSSVRSRSSKYGTLGSVRSVISIATSTDRTALRSSSGLSNRKVSGRIISGESEKMDVTPILDYVGDEQRRREKQEASELRLAMEKLDMKEELRVYRAAEEEATQLIQLHEQAEDGQRDDEENYAMIDESSLISRKRTSTRNKGPQETQQEIGQDVAGAAVKYPSYVDTTNAEASKQADIYFDSPAAVEIPTECVAVNTKTSGIDHSLRLENQRLASKPSLFSITNLSNRRKSSGSRKPSGARKTSLFANPDDKIYEDPVVSEVSQNSEEKTRALYPVHARRNPFVRAHSTRQSASGVKTPFSSKESLPEKIDMESIAVPSHPSKYMTKDIANEETQSLLQNDPTKSDADVKLKGGIEIRSDDIKAATTKKMSDRSPRLSSPTVSTTSPQRPIVSFDKGWTPPRTSELALPGVPISIGLQRPSPIPHGPRDGRPMDSVKSFSAPAVPTIDHVHMDENRIVNSEENKVGNTPHLKSPANGIPAINIIPDIPFITVDDSPTTPGDDISISKFPLPPTITINVDPPQPAPSSTNKLNQPSKPQSPAHPTRLQPSIRPTPHHSSTAPTRSSTPHWTPSVRRQTSLCATCALPISGRIVTAATARFHPECFVCHHCRSPLECVAFYPEPDTHRATRLTRARCHLEGEVDEEYVQQDDWKEDDGDESPRFYCHLDYHESFSPRCKGCKTPIEGEVILACGAEWHEGHFFCAQCGDPFDATTPNYIEKDGYAWCLPCHTNRFSPKCRRCRRPVVDVCVEAMGGQWCEGCFVCAICTAPFGDGRYFVRENAGVADSCNNSDRNMTWSTAASGKEVWGGKAQTAGLEAVCFECEARRLKA